jgi:hypothetical protein
MPTKCSDLKVGDRVRLLQGAWIGAEGTVIATCQWAVKTKYVPHPTQTQVWVRFDHHGEEHDIYDYQLEKIEKKVAADSKEALPKKS